MNVVYRVIGTVVLLAGAVFAAGQTPNPVRSASGSDSLSCSPTPCVFPPTQGSEGGAEVTDTPIVADPLNPTRLLLGSVDGNCAPPSDSGFHVSSDGGSTWQRTCLPLITDFQNRVYYPGGQPMVAYDLNGTAYIADHYGDSEGLGYGLIAMEESNDGVNWSPPIVALSEGYTEPVDSSMAVDTNASSPYVNSLYFAAVVLNEPEQNKNQMVVVHSHDGGKTWTNVNVAPAQIAPAGDAYTAMSVGKDGTVYLTWMYCDSGPFYFCSNNKGNMVYSKSSDGGNTWSSPVLMAQIVLGHGIPNSKVGVTNYPAIGVDNSAGPYAGNLYVVMYTWTGTYMRVQVIHSTDGGNSWSKPVPVAAASDRHDQFFPWLSVSPAGLVGVSWLDRRNDPDNVNYQAYAAVSNDGGKSFQPNVQLTTKFSNPNIGGPFSSMGDYSGNTWDGPNDFIAAWMDSSNGVDMQEEVGGIRLK